MPRALEVPAPGAAATRRGKVTARASAERWYEIRAAANGEVELFLYGEIGGYWEWGGVPVGDFVRDLAQVNAVQIRVRVNSPGGDVWGGIAVYNALVAHPARIVMQVDGIAASIASLIVMAGEEIGMGTGTRMMIHDPWLFTIGNARELRETADWLDSVGLSMAEIYAARAGITPDAAIDVMAEETWYTPEEAIAAGFADTVEAAQPATAPTKPLARFDLSIFANVPADLAGASDPAPAKRREPVKTVRQLEALLRDEGGLSHAAARAVAAGFKGSTSEPRDEDDGDAHPHAGLNIALARARLAVRNALN